MPIWSFIIGLRKLIVQGRGLAMSGVLLAQVSQAIAQGPDASPTMDFFEFLGSWNDAEGNFIDPMLLDTLTDLDHPINEGTGERPLLESGEEDSDEFLQEPHVDQDMPLKYDE